MNPPFQLNAGHPVLDFVNTLDNRFGDSKPFEMLGNYADLLRFSVQSGLIDVCRSKPLAGRQGSPAASHALRSARELREALAAIFYRGVAGSPDPAPADIKNLERQFHAAQSHQELVWKWPEAVSASPPTAEWGWGRSATQTELPVWILAQAADRMLTSIAMKKVHRCDSETCRWLFLDTSKNHSRKWCDMKTCGNRMKARRYLARQRG